MDIKDVLLNKNKKILFVGGMWNDDGGRPSSVVNKFSTALEEQGVKVDLYNGGFYADLTNIIELAIYYDYIFWWADVPNDKPKIRNVKDINSKCILVTSKRNDNNKYSFAELINRALEVKANLCVVFSKEDPIYTMSIMDPLGNSWYYGFGINECCNVLKEKIEYLSGITRQGTIHKEGNIEIPDEKEFFDIVRNYGDTFHDLIQPDKGVTRFLGNASFRCQRGFPSFRKGNTLFVSRRNVDKRFIDKESFVPVQMDEGKLYYYGDHKPSVDTPIQARLYDLYPNINYMLHSHVYIDGAPFTKNNVPCGGIEEVMEIMDVIGMDMHKDFYAINLIGHGCIVMAKDVKDLYNLPYRSRPMPEKISYKNV